MNKRVFSITRVIVGVGITLLGIVGLFYTTYPLDTRTARSPGGGGGTVFEVDVPTTLRMAESGIIRVGFTHYGDVNDVFGGRIPPHLEQLTMTLQTTSFDIAPSSGQSITKHIKEGIPYEWVWTIEPKQTGQYYVILDFPSALGFGLPKIMSELGEDQLQQNSHISKLDLLDNQTLESFIASQASVPLTVRISVVDIFGLTAIQAKILSIIFTVVAPGFGLVWLYEQWQKHRTEKTRSKQPVARKRKKSS